MLKRSFCDFGLIGLINESMSPEQIQEESKYLLGVKLYFNYPP